MKFIPSKDTIMAQCNNMGSVGGAGKSATTGGYNQGLQFAATGNYRGGVGSHQDLRKGNAAGSEGPGLANPNTGYNQGDQYAPTGQQAQKVGTHKDLRGGTSNPASGYNQGSTVVANKK